MLLNQHFEKKISLSASVAENPDGEKGALAKR
jgi:hypothetical protein